MNFMTVWLVASGTASVIGHPVDRSIAVIIYQLLLYVRSNIPIRSINYESKSCISVRLRVCLSPRLKPVLSPFAAWHSRHFPIWA